MKARSTLMELGAVLLLVLLVIVFFHHIIFTDRLIYGQDTVEQGYPFARLTSRQLDSGERPIWNPYMMSGMPKFSSRFTPLSVLNRNATLQQSMNRGCVWYAIFASVFMFFLMRRWRVRASGALVAALAFAFSGFFIPKIYAGHGGAFGSVVYAPLVFLLLDKTIESRRPIYAVLTGGVFGLQLLGGQPQYVYYTLLAMIGFTLYRIYPVALRPVKPRLVGAYAALMCLAGVFAAGVSAVYLLPFTELTALSSRGGGTGYTFSSSLSLPPASILTAIVPNIWGSPARDNSVTGALYWDTSMYIGVIPLMLALIAIFYSRHSKSAYFKWLAVASMLVALGGYTPLYRVLYHVPGFSLMRVPAKALVVYCFAMSVLAGYGMETLFAMERKTSRRLGVWLLIASGVVAAAALAYWVAKPAIMNMAATVIRETRHNPADLLRKLPGLYALQLSGLWAAVALTAIGALMMQMIATKTSVRLAPAALVILTFVDLAMFGRPLVKTIDISQAYKTGTAEVSFLQKQKGLFRVLPLQHSTFMYARGMLSGIQNVNGYYPVFTRRYAMFVAAANNQPMKVDVSADIRNHRSPLLDLLNVRYVISNSPLPDKDLRQVFHERAYIYERKTLPRAFLVHSAEIASSPDAALERMKSPTFDPRASIVIESPSLMPVARFAGMRDSVRISRYRDTSINLDVTAAAPGYLFLSETYYPGWNATLDGKTTPVLRANYLFRSVYIPAGAHKVTLVYDPSRRRWGEKLTAGFMWATLAACAAALVSSRLQRPAKKTSAPAT